MMRGLLKLILFCHGPIGWIILAMMARQERRQRADEVE